MVEKNHKSPTVNKYNIYPPDIVSYVESVQRTAHAKIGQDAERYRIELEQINRSPERLAICEKLRLRSALSGKKVDQWSEACTTKYQDPIIVGRFLEALKLVESRMSSSGGVQAIERPLIATLPLGFLNGLVCRDRTGRHGILLQEGMRFWPKTMAGLCSGFFLEGENLISPFNMSNHHITSAYEKDVTLSSEPIGMFYRDATMPYLLTGDRDPNCPMGFGAEARFEARFAEGFSCFVIAHEYSHCINDHFDISVSFRNQDHKYQGACPVPQRSSHEVAKTLERVEKLYPGLRVSEQQQTRYTNLQMLELAADAQAFEFCVNVALEDLGDEAWIFIMGAMSFFCYLEMTERVHRTANQGLGWINSPIYNGETDCWDILLRNEHPCNASRVKHMTESLDKGLLGIIGPIWNSLSEIFMISWACNIDAINEFYIRGELKIDQKWRAAITDDEILLGASDRRPESGFK